MGEAPFFRRRAPADPALRAQLSDRRDDDPPLVRRFVYSVGGIQRTLREDLERSFSQIWVGGEISSLNLHGVSGHAYFTLKDAQAQLRCVMWREAVQRLRFELKNGMEVIAGGRVTVFERTGQLQLTVGSLEPQGDGAAEEAFRQLAEKLKAEGLTADPRKRPIPMFPRAVGVVTSASGAALRDVVRTALLRDPFTRLVISPAQVQGDGAGLEIARAIERVDRFGQVEVIIVARGGGSREDLWAFNSELVARAIVAAKVPVITGIGHETDLSIADLVADRRCSTPTAAAEAAVPNRAEIRHRWTTLENRLTRATRGNLHAGASRLFNLERRLMQLDPLVLLRRRAQLIDELSTRAERCLRVILARRQQRHAALGRRLTRLEPRARIAAQKARIQLLLARLDRTAERALEARRQRLAVLASRLESLSPVAVLARGYALVRDDSGRLIRRAPEALPGQRLTIRVAEGEIRARVEASEAGSRQDD